MHCANLVQRIAIHFLRPQDLRSLVRVVDPTWAAPVSCPVLRAWRELQDHVITDQS